MTSPTNPASSGDAVARYQYLLRTASPDQIEQAHAEAFSQLTPQQRQEVLTQLAAAVPASERPRTDDAQTLARVATESIDDDVALGEELASLRLPMK